MTTPYQRDLDTCRYWQNPEMKRENHRRKYQRNLQNDPDFNRRHFEKYREYYRLKNLRRSERCKEQLKQKQRERQLRNHRPAAGTNMAIYQAYEDEILEAIRLEVIHVQSR